MVSGVAGVCQCGGIVSGATGQLSLDTRLAADRLRGVELWRAEHRSSPDLPEIMSHSALVSMPVPAEWCWSHDDCAPARNDYEIEASRLDDVGKVLDWTLHLMTKNWFDAIAWEHAVRRLYNLPMA